MTESDFVLFQMSVKILTHPTVFVLFCITPLVIRIKITYPCRWGFPGGAKVKNPPANTGDVGSIPRSGRLPGLGNGNPFQYSCLGNPTVHGVARVRRDLATKNNNKHPCTWFTTTKLFINISPLILRKNYLLFVFVFPTVLNTTLYTWDRVVKHCSEGALTNLEKDYHFPVVVSGILKLIRKAKL